MKQRMKALATLLFLLLLGTASHAEDLTLVIWQRDGGKVYYQLNEQPRTTFTASALVITTDLMQVSYPIDNIQRYTYEPTATGIEHVRAGRHVQLSPDGRQLSFGNLAAGTEIRLYSADGKLLNATAATGGAADAVSLAALPAGVYVVNVEGVTYKIMKK